METLASTVCVVGCGSSSMMGRELIEALPEVLKVKSAWGRPASPKGNVNPRPTQGERV
ncbi:MAG: hypothetical protein QXS62_06180 [Sulfolobales archaeon]